MQMEVSVEEKRFTARMQITLGEKESEWARKKSEMWSVETIKFVGKMQLKKQSQENNRKFSP